MSDAPRIVRTRTGKKLHRANRGSVMTWCGIRHAGPVHFVHRGASGCALCGIDPTATQDQLEQLVRS